MSVSGVGTSNTASNPLDPVDDAQIITAPTTTLPLINDLFATLSDQDSSEGIIGKGTLTPGSRAL